MTAPIPRVVVVDEGNSNRITEAPPELGQPHAQLLLSRSALMSDGEGAVAHCEPLGDQRWAVGRQVRTRRGEAFVWRVVPRDVVHAMGGHPAWLWTSDAWFDAGQPLDAPLPLPASLPLRELLELAGPALERVGPGPGLLASVVESLRSGTTEAKPTALVVDRPQLTSAEPPARWLALAMLALLPPSLAQRLRIHVGGVVQPGDADLALVPEAPRGFAVLGTSPPRTESTDVIGYFIRDRLEAGDPEAIEVSALLFDRGGSAWVDGVVELIRDGLAGSSEVLRGIRSDAGGGSLADRLRGGLELSPPVIEQMVASARASADPAPWAAIWRHPAVQRSQAVRALVDNARHVRPSPALVQELCGVYPRGATLDGWMPALLHWLEQGVATTAVAEAIQTTLLEWPDAVTMRLLPRVWPKVVRALASFTTGAQAAEALLRSPMAQAIASSGAIHVLVRGWGQLPASERTSENLDALAERLAEVPEPEQVAAIFDEVRSSPPVVEALVTAWVRATARRAHPRDPLLAAVRGSPAEATWAEALRSLEPGLAKEALRRWAPDPGDPLRGGPRPRPESRPSRAATPAPAPPSGAPAPSLGGAGDPGNPRELLLKLGRQPVAKPGLEQRLLSIAEAALAQSRFPDREVASLAESLAGQSDTNRVWGWLALAAGAPGTWGDDVVDATVYAFCFEPPSDTAGRQIAVQAARSLGEARRWEPVDHARWLVRLALAPPGPLNKKLAQALLEGIGRRTDGTPFLADMFVAILELPPDHQATSWMLELLIPSGWRGDRLRRVLRAVPRERVPHQLRDAWSALLAAAGEA